METKELMIGNIVFNKFHKEYARIMTIEDFLCMVHNGACDGFEVDNVNSNLLSPVELDSEWILKIDGLKESESGDYYLIVLKGSADMPLLYRTRNGWSVSIGMKLRDYEFKYVHQLQNIVKIITGCNLKIEL